MTSWTVDVAIKETINDLCAKLASENLSNPQVLAGIHSQFEEIGQWAKEHSEPNVIVAAEEMADLVEKIILEEAPDRDASLEAVRKTAATLQELYGEEPMPGGEEAALRKEESKIDIKESVETLSESLVLSNLSDMQVLAGIHSLFETINRWAQEQSESKIASATSSAMNLIEKLIFREIPDASSAIDTLNKTVSVLQTVLCEGRSADQAEFPPELERIPVDKKSQLSALLTQDKVERQESAVLSPPPGVEEAMFADFLTRQASALEEMEEHFLILEKEDNEENKRALHRLIHTLKGEAGMLGLHDIERLCHAAEDLIKRIQPSKIIDILLNVKDWLSQTFDAYAGKKPKPKAIDRLLIQIEKAEEPPPAEEKPAEPPPPESVEPPAAIVLPADMDMGILHDFISEALEHLDASDVHLLTLETEPTNEEALNAVFRAFHTIKGVAGCLELGEIRSLAHEAESLLDRARKGNLVLEGEAIDITFAAVDAMKYLVNNLKESLASGSPLSPYEELPQLVAGIQAVIGGRKTEKIPAPAKAAPSPLKDFQPPPKTPESVQPKPSSLPPEKPAAAPAPAVKPEEPSPSATTPPLAAKSTAPVQGIKIKEVVKVDADRLDHLVETIGELVIAFSMVRQSFEKEDIHAQRLDRHLRQLDKITRELQGMGTSLRMVPIRATFQKMARLVRDLSHKTNKPIEFVLSGEDTELDKAVVDKIGDPLVHMMRNAVDHGIEESKEKRRLANKPETGRIELRAFHKGGNILIEIEDDGRGLDREAILAKSRERGLIRDGDSLSEREIFNLIFEPGFSTAKKITEVSGRGVGMDVVKRNIESLRGQVDIRSEFGKGSVFTIRLPLTLAIIDGMVVRVGNERYIIPTLSIIQSLQPRRSDLTTVMDRGEMLKLQGRLVPLFRLGRLFRLKRTEPDPTEALTVVVEDNEKLAGLIVDELIGQQQIVIKSIGEIFQGLPGIAGGAILPDGRVGLILDVGGLVRLANEGAKIRSPRETAAMPD